MEPKRRRFLRQLATTAGALTFTPFLQTAAGRDLLSALEEYERFPADRLAVDETFWRQVRQAYTVSPTVLYLNSGGVCPQPKVVQEAVERYNRLSNEGPAFYMWQVLDKGREPLREKLADLAGCSPDEIAVNRNASEALETVIFGLPLTAGDEVVLSRYDYPNMINAWKQRELRDGIRLNWIDLDLPMEDDEAIVQRYAAAFTPATKVVHITHVINWTGQILPAARIAEAAHRQNIEVLVDGAHSFAHLDYRIPDLGCDYFGTSLHKWMCAPFGSGMLYVRKEKIAGLYPLFAAPEPGSDDIRKFEALGTRSFAIEQAIGQAVDFHLLIGAERKEKRLHFLKNYWAEQVAELPWAQLHTSLKPEFGCAIGLLNMEGMKPGELAQTLFREHQIFTVAIEWEKASGIRVTPNVFTLQSELDRFVEALKTIAS